MSAVSEPERAPEQQGAAADIGGAKDALKESFVVEPAESLANQKEIVEPKRKVVKRNSKLEKDRELLQLAQRYHGVVAERDAAIAVKEKLESLCREFQRQNKMLKMTSKNGYPGPIWFIMYNVHVKDALPPFYEAWLEEIINFVSLNNHMVNFGLSSEDFIYYETEDEYGYVKLIDVKNESVVKQMLEEFKPIRRVVLHAYRRPKGETSSSKDT